MPQVPPTVRVGGKGSTEKLRELVNQVSQAMNELSDYLAETAVQLHPDIVELLRQEGLDGTNRFGMGSSASATANGFVRIMKRAAEQAESTAKIVRAAHLYWTKNIKVPVEVAQKARNVNRTKLEV
jgi:methyl-accepting chemotaxis protein